MKKCINVSGIGCCLLDRIYSDIDFTSQEFQQFVSKKTADGGLVPGELKLEEEFEQFCQRPFPSVLQELTENRRPDSTNIGGPCIVALINAAQITGEQAHISFHGCYGNDDTGRKLLEIMDNTTVDISHYTMEEGCSTPSTTVFSDPNYDGGHGERIFVNTIGAAWHLTPERITEDFLAADICMFGATALTPHIHENLHALLPLAKQKGTFTLVTTVYDTINQRKKPHRWPLGANDDSYAHIDLLITDSEEALRMSGTDNVADALRFFEEKGVGAAIVTNGTRDIMFFAHSPIFGQIPLTSLPICHAVGKALKEGGTKGDTTGCGDNFAGGVLASIIQQKHNGNVHLDLREACKWGVVSGGFTCFHYGGTYIESQPGEKLSHLLPLYEYYSKQIDNP